MKIIGLERLEIDRLPTTQGAVRTNPALPDSPAIYFVHIDGVIFYIGATKSLYKRWRNAHHALAHLPEKFRQRLQLSWLVVNRALLSEVETELIQRFHPKLNRGTQRYPRKGRWDK